MIKPRNLKFVLELISASVVLETFFNYVDLNYEPFNEIIFNFSSSFQSLGLNQFSTVLISISISLGFVSIKYSLHSKIKIINFMKTAVIYPLIFLGFLYLFQIFDLPRSYLLIYIFVFFIYDKAVDILYELISKNFKLSLASFLIFTSALIYVSNIILPIDSILLVRKANLVEIQNIRSESNFIEHDKDFLYQNNEYVTYSDSINFENISVDIYKMCCEELSFYNQFMKNVGYINLHNENLIVVNGFGDTFFIDKSKLIDNKSTKLVRIENNLKSLIKNKNVTEINNESRFSGQDSIKGAVIHDNKLYVSFVENQSDTCVNIQIAVGDFDLSKIQFNNFFNTNECVEREMATIQHAGGKMLFDNKDLFFTVGSFGTYEEPQDSSSIFGKTIKINIETQDWEVVSLGHKNSQGLSFTKNNNYIIQTEHGPRFGDEINLIDLNEIKNYGYPIASYGIHYGDLTGNNFEENEPFYKPHSDYGFEEPIYYWSSEMNSNGISSIIEKHDKENVFYATSLNGNNLYELKVNFSELKVESIFSYNLRNRIRDIIYDSDLDLYFLLLEENPSIAVLKNISD